MNKQSVFPRCRLSSCVAILATLLACGSNTQPTPSTPENSMTSAPELTQREKVIALLESMETGDQTPVSYINPNKYVQHNLAVGDGLAGFGAVLQNKPPQGFKANVIRAFEDGDFVFTHTEYDFFGPKVGFDVFRFEDGLIVEHWDNLVDIAPPNPSGRTQLDGATEVADLNLTEDNKKLVSDFVDSILVKGDMSKLAGFFDGDNYLQHNSAVADGLSGLGAALKVMAEQGITMEYDRVHRVLGQGNFVLTMSEGTFAGRHSAYYDLFRVENGKIAEHWDVIEPILEEDKRANQNGKF